MDPDNQEELSHLLQRDNTPQINRNPMTGHFLPGASPNPGGRPKETITAALREMLRNGKAEVLADKLVKHAEKGKPNISLAAIGMITDRDEGKAIQQHKIEASMDENTAKRLAELALLLGVDKADAT